MTSLPWGSIQMSSALRARSGGALGSPQYLVQDLDGDAVVGVSGTDLAVEDDVLVPVLGGIEFGLVGRSLGGGEGGGTEERTWQRGPPPEFGSVETTAWCSPF